VKTIHPLLILVSLVTGLCAQPTPGPATPAASPVTNRDALRQSLERTFAQATNSPGALAPTIGQPPTNSGGAIVLGGGVIAAPKVADAPATPAAPTTPAIGLLGPVPTVPSPGQPVTPEAASPLPTRAVRTATTGTPTDTNAKPAALIVPAFPAFPTPGVPTAQIPPTTPAPPTIQPPTAQVPPPVRPGATPLNPGIAPANGGIAPPNVAGKPANGAAVTGLATSAKNDDEATFAPGMIKFQDSDLLQVLDIYQDLTGRTVVRPNSLPATKVSVRSQTPLSRKEAVQLLDTVLAMNGITMIPQGEKSVKAVPQATAPTEAAIFQDPDNLLSDTTRYITKVVQLKNAIPRDVTAALQPLAKMPNSIMAIDSSGILVLRDYEENIKRMEELLEKIDVVAMNEYEPVVIPIKYALASDIAQVLSSLTAGGGSATTVGSHPASTGLSSQGGLQPNRGGIGGGAYGQQGGLPGQQGYGNTAGGLGGAGGIGAAGGLNSPAAGRSSFQDRLRSIVNRAASGAAGDIVVLGQTKIIADERTNSLLVFATKGDIDTITNIIAKLDVVLAQVIIEAIIMEVSLGTTLDYGVSAVQRQPTGNNYFSGIGGMNNGSLLSQSSFTALASNGVPSIASGFSYAARFGQDFDATATAIATDSRINVLSRPRIQTSHAVEANLFVGETRPYITGTYSYLGSGPSSQYSQLQIGITLSVLPLINIDGLVVMDIRQKIQSIGGFTTIDNNQIPTTIDREANAKVAVRNKETVMLGGFISTDNSKNASGIPILKDIPILGNLFRSTSKTSNRKELMVLIRPTVLDTPKEAALIAQQEKAKMPGIRAAEREAARDERRQTKKLGALDSKEQSDLEQEELKEQKKINSELQKQQKKTSKGTAKPDDTESEKP